MANRLFPALFWPGSENKRSSDTAGTSGAGDDMYGPASGEAGSLREVAVKPAAEPTKRLSLDIPRGLHKRFKTACAANDRSMVAELLTFIEQRTEKLEKKAGIQRS